MTEHQAIVLDMPPPTEIQREAASIIDVIARAARDSSIDVDKLERLLALQQTLLADQRRTAFMAALAALQAELPQITKHGHISTDGGKTIRSTFARIEDVDVAIRPLCKEYGFAFSFDSKVVGANAIEFSCTMSHRDGHSETKTMTLQSDASGGKNAVQAVGSTTSYARRYLLSMHLHLVTREEDDDGQGSADPVTPEQAAELRGALASVKGNEARFLNWLAAESFEAIPAANYRRAMAFIEEKRRTGQ